MVASLKEGDSCKKGRDAVVAVKLFAETFKVYLNVLLGLRTMSLWTVPERSAGRWRCRRREWLQISGNVLGRRHLDIWGLPFSYPSLGAGSSASSPIVQSEQL